MKRPSLSRPACAGVLLLAAAPLLGGCSDLSRTFGFAHNSPDEFSVTTARRPRAAHAVRSLSFILPMPSMNVPTCLSAMAGMRLQPVSPSKMRICSN